MSIEIKKNPTSFSYSFRPSQAFSFSNALKKQFEFTDGGEKFANNNCEDLIGAFPNRNAWVDDKNSTRVKECRDAYEQGTWNQAYENSTDDRREHMKEIYNEVCENEKPKEGKKYKTFCAEFNPAKYDTVEVAKPYRRKDLSSFK